MAFFSFFFLLVSFGYPSLFGVCPFFIPYLMICTCCRLPSSVFSLFFFFPSHSSLFPLLVACKFGWLVMTQLWILHRLQLPICNFSFAQGLFLVPTCIQLVCSLVGFCYPFPEYMQRKGERGMVHKVYKVKFSIVESEVQLLTCEAFGPSTPALAQLPVHHLGWTVYKEETLFLCVTIP
jgi:hypothetical protein